MRRHHPNPRLLGKDVDGTRLAKAHFAQRRLPMGRSSAMRWSMRSAYMVGGMWSAFVACDFSGNDTNNFRPDVVYCEEALSYLASCCPKFDAGAVSCQYAYYSGATCFDKDGSPSGLAPTFSQSESQCILDESCKALVSTGVCARAEVHDAPGICP